MLALVCVSSTGLRIQVFRVLIHGEVPTAVCSNVLGVFVCPRRCSYFLSCLVEIPFKLNKLSSVNMNWKQRNLKLNRMKLTDKAVFNCVDWFWLTKWCEFLKPIA